MQRRDSCLDGLEVPKAKQTTPFRPSVWQKNSNKNFKYNAIDYSAKAVELPKDYVQFKLALALQAVTLTLISSVFSGAGFTHKPFAFLSLSGIQANVRVRPGSFAANLSVADFHVDDLARQGSKYAKVIYAQPQTQKKMDQLLKVALEQNSSEDNFQSSKLMPPPKR